jgi:hypothetical protein
MGKLAIQTDIMTKVAAIRDEVGNPYASTPIEGPNTAVIDTQQQSNPFLSVDIRYTNAGQRDLSSVVTQRFVGLIVLSVAVKDGKGTVGGLPILEHYTLKMQAKSFGKVRTLVADTLPDKPHLGWTYLVMAIPFWSDQPT